MFNVRSTAVAFLAGAGCALLFAPRSGVRTRRILKAQANQAVNSLKDGVEQVRDVVEDSQISVKQAKQTAAKALQVFKHELAG